ncbi:trypsin-like serine peptidase [Lysinibacillus sphaericus]|uniref:Serine protease n=1 Tax=Lysinibacillus sphaericus OT4b.31 TaxID=1285586 RepID=R7ZE90_LYSSH|nr:trypsin-like peptidase domain-containing protein [Lysinibacillus sphaericus]EON72442.1 glutamyl endopeptidase [Lysinibacillus sphaericus OT4b.31]
MKKITFKFFFMLMFLLVPMNVFAEGSLGNFSFDPSQASHPYDMVNSKGEVIKYEEFENSNSQFNNEIPSIQGTGEISPVQIDSIIESHSYIDLTPPPVIINDFISNDPIQISSRIVIDEDSRKKVENTKELPYSAITYIEIQWPDGTGGSCTGTLIGKNKVLTNGHCVIKPETKESITSAKVYPGVNNSVGLFGSYNVNDYYVAANWASTGSSSEDFAVLVLDVSKDNKQAGDVAGSLGIKQVNNLLNQNIDIYGYPGDLMQASGEISQFGMRGNITREDASVAFYTIDTAPGQSGSALINTDNQIVGVHRGSFVINGNPINGGPKMNTYMFNFVSKALE